MDDYPDKTLLSRSNVSTLNDRYIFCAEPSNKLQVVKDKVCESGKWEHYEISQEKYAIENDNGKIVLKDSGIPKKYFDVDSKYYCVCYDTVSSSKINFIISYAMSDVLRKYVSNILI